MKIKHQFFQNSQCLGSYLHRFKIVKEWGEQVLEVCDICHKSQFFKVVDGQLDKDNYMSYHVREALGNIPIPNYIFHEYKYQPLQEDKLISPYHNA